MRDVPTGRGQSEALGFLLIFGIVVLAIALVGATGVAGIDGLHAYQRTSNAEQAFETLAADVADVLHDGVPSRATAFSIDEASLRFEETETTIGITASNGTTWTRTVVSHPLVYDSGTGTTITYRNGALIRSDRGSAVLLRQPDFVLTDEEVVLPVVNATPDGHSTVGGHRSVTVLTQRDDTELIATDAPVTSITLTVTTDHPAVWVRYFERYEDGGPVTTVTQTGDHVVVTMAPERASVIVHRITVTMQ